MYPFLVAVSPFVSIALSFLFAFGPIVLSDSKPIQLVLLLLSPVMFILALILSAGVLSRLGLRGVKKGKFERKLTDPVYGPRRIHAVCWNLIFYSGPIYNVILGSKTLTKLLFRLFGYTGNMNFSLAPDAWIRDLPLLNFGDGVYISNKSSVATNMTLTDGQILVDGITMGNRSTLGHSSLIAPGTTMAENVQIEAFVLSGVRNKYGKNTQVGDRCALDHAVRVGENTVIGSGSIVSIRASIGDNIVIPDGSHIHSGVRIKSQADADLYYSEETAALTRSRATEIDRVQSVLAKFQTDDHPSRTR